jgi:hypothetical protein
LAKKATKQKRAAVQHSSELAKVNAARAQTRRLLNAHRNLRELTRRTRTAYERAAEDVSGLLMFLAMDAGFVVVPIEQHEGRQQVMAQLESELARLRARVENPNVAESRDVLAGA